MSLRLKHLVLVLCVVSGCSIYMESTRPTPTDLEKFTPGDSRTSVMEKLGSPVTTSKGVDGNSCDLYLLYTRGYGIAGKAPIVLGEAAADFFTIGLAEIVLSPTEAATKNEKRPVWFCYQNEALVSVTVKSAETETPTSSPTPTPSPASSSPSSSASFSPTPVPSESPTPAALATPASSNSASATPTATAPAAEPSQ
jgi:hypothetical protein